jgi:hypothetical protein
LLKISKRSWNTAPEAEESSGVGDGSGADRAGSAEIKSWQVFYMPRVFEVVANASPDVFPQLSSPTQETLVPGRYVMWVRDPTTARLGERTVVKVGEGKMELLLDLPVPAALPDDERRPPACSAAAANLAGCRCRSSRGSRRAAHAPPPVLAESNAGGRSFAALASAAIVGLSILPFILWRADAAACLAGCRDRRTDTRNRSVFRRWVRPTACTARYVGKPIVIGTEMTTLGATYRQANSGLSSDDLLFDAAGAPERIWTRESIDRCRTLIATSYFLWIPCLVVCLLATAQAVPASVLSPVRWDAPAPTRGRRQRRATTSF